MTPEERAGLFRVWASVADLYAARLRLAASAVEAGEAFAQFARVWQDGIDADLAEHPDLAELNVRMDALYDQ